jgi:hypothetical protein
VAGWDSAAESGQAVALGCCDWGHESLADPLIELVVNLIAAVSGTPETSFCVRLNLRVESGSESCAKLSKRNGTAAARPPEKRS